jgi:hypothetical protein
MSAKPHVLVQALFIAAAASGCTAAETATSTAAADAGVAEDWEGSAMADNRAAAELSFNTVHTVQVRVDSEQLAGLADPVHITLALDPELKRQVLHARLPNEGFEVAVSIPRASNVLYGSASDEQGSSRKLQLEVYP